MAYRLDTRYWCDGSLKLRKKDLPIDAIAQALADPMVRGWYLAFSLALLVVPMAALWLWYRSRAKAGTVDKAVAVRVSVLTLVWMIVNALVLGLLMWADGVNQAAAG